VPDEFFRYVICRGGAGGIGDFWEAFLMMSQKILWSTFNRCPEDNTAVLRTAQSCA
jgi:hypothetical protein